MADEVEYDAERFDEWLRSDSVAQLVLRQAWAERMDKAMGQGQKATCLPNDLGRCPIHGEIKENQ